MESSSFATIPWLVHAIIVFHLTGGIFNKAIIRPRFRGANDTKSEV